MQNISTELLRKIRINNFTFSCYLYITHPPLPPTSHILLLLVHHSPSTATNFTHSLATCTSLTLPCHQLHTFSFYLYITHLPLPPTSHILLLLVHHSPSPATNLTHSLATCTSLTLPCHQLHTFSCYLYITHPPLPPTSHILLLLVHHSPSPATNFTHSLATCTSLTFPCHQLHTFSCYLYITRPHLPPTSHILLLLVLHSPSPATNFTHSLATCTSLTLPATNCVF